MKAQSNLTFDMYKNNAYKTQRARLTVWCSCMTYRCVARSSLNLPRCRRTCTWHFCWCRRMAERGMASARRRHALSFSSISSSSSARNGHMARRSVARLLCDTLKEVHETSGDLRYCVTHTHKGLTFIGSCPASGNFGNDGFDRRLSCFVHLVFVAWVLRQHWQRELMEEEGVG